MFASRAGRIAAWIGFALFAMSGVAGAWYIWGGGFDPTPVGSAADDDDDDDDDTPSDAGPGARPKAKKTGSRGKGGKRAKKPKANGLAGPTGPGGMSYEAALSGNNRQVGIGNKDAPDLTNDQLAGPMRNATFLGVCGVPSSTRVTVKVAVRGGHAVGVSVYSTPQNAEADGCVDRRVRQLYWPYSGKLDSFVTTY
jgi:hypothetical protein